MSESLPNIGRKADLIYEAITHLRPLVRLLHDAVAHELADAGITVAARAVMEQLRTQGPRPVPELARALGVQRQSAQHVVDAMLARGHAERMPNPAHRRSQRIRLTPEGERIIDAVRVREQRNLEGVARALEAGDIQACAKVLAHLRHHFSEERLWKARA